MIIKNGIIFIWVGTNASIPSGWSRVTGLDGNYPKGTAVATNPNVTGGSATHSHASSAHTHTASDHTHTISVASTTATGTGSGGSGQPSIHNHANFTSGSVASFTCDSPSATYASVSNDPPYLEVIYITPTTYTFFLPSGVVGLGDSAVPSGFNVCDGSNGTPNLVAKYLKGVTGGGDAGGTGGSTTNIHPLSHTHTTSHGHASATSAGPSANTISNSGSGTVPTTTHTHAVTLPAPSSNNASTDTPSTTTTETVEPAYKKLLAIQAPDNKKAPNNIIAMWLGTLASIPIGWVLCDGSNGTQDMRDKHLKITATLGEVGNSGGSNTHAHSASGHTHTLTASTHSTSVSHSSSGKTVTSSGSTTKGETGHNISTNAVSLVLASTNTTGNSASNEPPFRTVAFIKLVGKRNPEMLLNFVIQ